MGTIGRFFAATVAAMAWTHANATFHLFQISELYSNADGSVQFVELTALASGQEFVGGHTITASQGSTVHSYTLPTNLPGDTAGKRFLIATQGFAALGVVTPDYVVPNGFFPLGNGTVNWADADIWNYTGLPSDGDMALLRSGGTASNSAQNFAGATGHVGPGSGGIPNMPTTGDYEGLWWKSPASSESGWGLNITHQGNILFATWFTYDADGSGMWLVMPAGQLMPAMMNNPYGYGEMTQMVTYSGALYRTTGPAFSSTPFDPNAVHATLVGNATLEFSDSDHGTFTYTVNAVTQAKAITRQIFSTVPSCNFGTLDNTVTNYQDLWWKSPASSESGWGVNIAHQGDILFATWFTYDANNHGLWLVMPAGVKTGAGTYAGDLYRTTGPSFDAVPWDPSRVVATKVGSATFSFSDADNGTFTATVDGTQSVKAITRQVFATPTTVCH